jgi:predicted transcriptional regulator
MDTLEYNAVESKGQYKTKKMREIIKERGLSQRSIAKDAGIPKSYFNDCVRDDKPPRMTPLQTDRLCKSLGLSFDELVAMYESDGASENS